MTTLYKFKVIFTKAGIGAIPSAAPTVTVVDVDADSVLVNAQPAVGLTSLAGYYEYDYSGADGLDVVAVFHTTDADVDQQDMYSYNPPLLIGSNGGDESITNYPVTDSVTGLPVQGATVELYPTAARVGIINSKVSNVLGLVTFDNLVSGTYYLKVIVPGYDTFLDSEVTDNLRI